MIAPVFRRLLVPLLSSATAMFLLLPALMLAQAITTSSQPEGIQIILSSEHQPVPLNIMHSWVIQLQSVSGAPVEDAVIAVNGGMPAHNHGLATSPQVTQYLGEGRYLLEGIRFHMSGDWVLQLQIEHEGLRYRAEAGFKL